MFKKLLLAVVGVAIIAGVGFAADPQAPTMPFYWVNGVVKNPEKLGGRDLYVYAQNYGTGYLRVAVDTVTGAFRFNVYELKYYHNNDNWMEVGGKPVFIMSVVRKWGGADPLNYGTSEISSVNWAKGYIDADLELVLNGGPNDFSGGQIAGFVSDEATKQMIGGAGLAETPVGAKATTANDGTYMFADTFDTNSVHNVAASKTGYETGMVMDLTVKPTKVSWANFALKTGVGADNGLIKSIYLFPESGKVKLTWQYKDATVTGAVIYRSIKNDFSKNTADWTGPIATINSPANSYEDTNGIALADGQTAYYMVMPIVSGVPIGMGKMFSATPGDYLGKDAGNNPYTSWPVTKFDLTFAAGETKLMGYQFFPTNNSGLITSLQTITSLAGFTSGAIWYNNGGVLRANCNAGTWTSDINVGLSTGYWLMSADAKTYTFGGALIANTYEKPMLLGSDMYSYALPVNITEVTPFVGGGFTSGDSIWVNKGGLLRLNYGSGWSGTFNLTPGDGFWYLNSSSGKKLITIP